MANVNIELGYKNLAWFTANPTVILLAGQIVYLEQTGTYKIGDGVTQLSVLSFLGISSETQTLQNVTDLGNTTTNDIQFDAGVGVLLDNTSRLREGTIDAGYGGNKGIAQICAVGYELKWESGTLYVMDGNGTHIRHSLYNFASIPSATEDISKGFLVGTRWSLDNGDVYVCTDNTITAAVWVLETIVIPTKTSDLTNDGDDGNPFISLNDLPSNLILYATTAASDIPTYVKLVSSITDPSYNTIAADVSTGAITTTNQFISSLATSSNIIVGNPGVLNITTIGNIRRTSGTGNAEFYFEVWKRVLAGTETLITTSGNTIPVINTGYAEFSATALWNDGIFLPTDRIVLKFYGSRIVGGSNPTYDFQFGGSTPVRSLVPLPLTVIPVLNLDDLQDVTIASIANNEILTYESSTSLWKNKTVVSALGFTPYNATNPSGYITSSALTPYALIANPTFTTAITTPIVNGVNGNLAFNNAVQTSGAVTAFTFTKPNNTTQTASTQINGFVVNGGTRQWNTGAITTQNENVWGATTYSFVGASTITNAYGNVFNAPIAGTNCTITNNFAAQFNGNVVIGSTGQLIEIKQTANNPTYTQTGTTSSLFTNRAGTRSLVFESYASDLNYIRSNGAKLGILAPTAGVSFFVNSTEKMLIGATTLFLLDGYHIQTGITTGTIIGTNTTQKLSFWNATPIVQPATGGTASTFVSNTSLIANDTATFDGYTIGQIVKALRNMGLLA